jgi:hypothetical protein
VEEGKYCSTNVKARVSIFGKFAATRTEEWRVLGASVPGHHAFEDQRECQDYCGFIALAERCGLLMVADGAGSSKHADIGARFAVEFAYPHSLKRAISAAAARTATTVPELLKSISREDWASLSQETMAEARTYIHKFARKIDVEINDLSSTFISCIICPERLLVAHIGDGRGTFRGPSDQWLPLFEPTIGESVGETIFLTSPIYDSPQREQLIGSDIHEGTAHFVAIMTDGCEKGTFQINIRDEALGKFVRSNIPFSGFFNALPEFVKDLLSDEQAPDEAWAGFLVDGTKKFTEEYDDKTMIVAIRNAS